MGKSHRSASFLLQQAVGARLHQQVLFNEPVFTFVWQWKLCDRSTLQDITGEPTPAHTAVRSVLCIVMRGIQAYYDAMHPLFVYVMRAVK